MSLASPHHNSSFVTSPKIQDATLTIDLAASMRLWKISCDAVVSELSGSSSSLATLLQTNQPITITHYLFKQSKKRPAPSDSDSGEKPDKPTKRQKKPQAEKNKEVLAPSGSYTVQDLLQLKQEGKIKIPRLPHMKGIQNKMAPASAFHSCLGASANLRSPVATISKQMTPITYQDAPSLTGNHFMNGCKPTNHTWYYLPQQHLMRNWHHKYHTYFSGNLP